MIYTFTINQFGGVMNLAEMKRGESGVILSLECKGDLFKRLRALGIEPGVELKVLEKSLGSSNIQIESKGVKFALRLDEAKTIEVKKNG